jgi:hypothetical protein
MGVRFHLLALAACCAGVSEAAQLVCCDAQNRCKCCPGAYYDRACVACVPGAFCSNGVSATPCPAGTYNARYGAADAGACLAWSGVVCPTGRYIAAAPNATNDIACAACRGACPAGQYLRFPDLATCVPCAAGAFSAGAGASCAACAASPATMPGSPTCLLTSASQGGATLAPALRAPGNASIGLYGTRLAQIVAVNEAAGTLASSLALPAGFSGAVLYAEAAAPSTGAGFDLLRLKTRAGGADGAVGLAPLPPLPGDGGGGVSVGSKPDTCSNGSARLSRF